MYLQLVKTEIRGSLKRDTTALGQVTVDPVVLRKEPPQQRRKSCLTLCRSSGRTKLATLWLGTHDVRLRALEVPEHADEVAGLMLMRAMEDAIEKELGEMTWATMFRPLPGDCCCAGVPAISDKHVLSALNSGRAPPGYEITPRARPLWEAAVRFPKVFKNIPAQELAWLRQARHCTLRRGNDNTMLFYSRLVDGLRDNNRDRMRVEDQQHNLQNLFLELDGLPPLEPLADDGLRATVIEREIRNPQNPKADLVGPWGDEAELVFSEGGMKHIAADFMGGLTPAEIVKVMFASSGEGVLELLMGELMGTGATGSIAQPLRERLAESVKRHPLVASEAEVVVARLLVANGQLRAREDMRAAIGKYLMEPTDSLFRIIMYLGVVLQNNATALFYECACNLLPTCRGNKVEESLAAELQRRLSSMTSMNGVPDNALIAARIAMLRAPEGGF